MKRIFSKLWLTLIGSSMLLPAIVFGEDAVQAPAPVINSGDTAWILTSSALVLLMTVPALALFYGGMVKKKNIL